MTRTCKINMPECWRVIHNFFPGEKINTVALNLNTWPGNQKQDFWPESMQSSEEKIPALKSLFISADVFWDCAINWPSIFNLGGSGGCMLHC